MDCIPERQKPEQPDQLLEAEAPFHKKISIREIKSVKTNDKSAVNKESKCPLRRRERLWMKICNRTIDILAAAANVPQNTYPQKHTVPSASITFFAGTNQKDSRPTTLAIEQYSRGMTKEYHLGPTKFYYLQREIILINLISNCPQ